MARQIQLNGRGNQANEKTRPSDMGNMQVQLTLDDNCRRT